MDKKEIRSIWYIFAGAFFLLGAFTDKTYIFSPIACCCIIIGNMQIIYII